MIWRNPHRYSLRVKDLNLVDLKYRDRTSAEKASGSVMTKDLPCGIQWMLGEYVEEFGSDVAVCIMSCTAKEMWNGKYPVPLAKIFMYRYMYIISYARGTRREKNHACVFSTCATLAQT